MPNHVHSLYVLVLPRNWTVVTDIKTRATIAQLRHWLFRVNFKNQFSSSSLSKVAGEILSTPHGCKCAQSRPVLPRNWTVVTDIETRATIAQLRHWLFRVNFKNQFSSSSLSKVAGEILSTPHGCKCAQSCPQFVRSSPPQKLDCCY